MDEEKNIVLLTDEDGAESEYEYLSTVEMDGKLYAVMMPHDEALEDSDEREVIVLAIVRDDDGSDGFVTLEDEDEMERVFELFLNQMDAEEAQDEEADTDEDGEIED